MNNCTVIRLMLSPQQTIKQTTFFISNYLTPKMAHIRRNKTAINNINILFCYKR